MSSGFYRHGSSYSNHRTHGSFIAINSPCHCCEPSWWTCELVLVIPATENIFLSPPWSPAPCLAFGFHIQWQDTETLCKHPRQKLFQLITDICTWVIPHGLLFKCTVRVLPVDTTLYDAGQAAARGKADIPVSQMGRLGVQIICICARPWTLSDVAGYVWSRRCDLSSPGRISSESLEVVVPLSS